MSHEMPELSARAFLLYDELTNGPRSGKAHMKKYDHIKIEKKWQKEWEKKGIYKTKDKSSKPKYYVLDMFPYPSGEGLHVGHPKGYIATDVLSRFKRMNGFNVLHPMGWDAFGLPAENYAIKNKVHPKKAVEKNIKRFKEQLEIIGLDYDWSREINTTDPKYYKWTQWAFLKMLEKGLAYQSFEPVNWCPSCKTVLANEDLEDGKCERCGSVVEKRPLRQWVLKITDYADRLLNDLDATDYVMPKLVDKVNPHRPGAPLVERRVAHAIVYDPKKKKYLIIRNKEFGWDTVVIGGIEGDESPVETARREVREETGYTDLEFKRLLGGPTEALYYTKHKGQNRIAYAQAVYFELRSEARVPIAEGENKNDEILWIDEKDFVPGKMVNSELPVWLERLKDPTAGVPQPLLDWPESIKESQRNWIGRSEGSEIDFKTEGSKEVIKVFTTRADTLFGVTYVVLAPESPLVKSLWDMVKNKDEVSKYIEEAKNKPEIERTAEGKEKTGVELRGVSAINPANGEKVPVWVADYVLASYGTGAVMAVPAHDERDWQFAKKYKLPIREVVAPYFKTTTGQDAVRPDKPTVKRRSVFAIVKHWQDNKYLLLKWHGFGWQSFVIGGIEEGENEEVAARREVVEETGYTDLKRVERIPGEIHSEFFAGHKDVNRRMDAVTYFIELGSGARQNISEDEKKIHEPVWVEENKVAEFVNLQNHSLAWKKYRGLVTAHTDAGVLINSGKFDGMESKKAKDAVTEFVAGKKVVKYKLRDWVFSRQRYWGEPIPVIHCEKCGVVPVPEKDLPVELPKVTHYEPTGTGESPLAAIEKWVNVKCPKCKGEAKRETNTMPQWAGSSWYYLRYEDPKNSKALVDKKKEKYWSPVDMYVGGAEHATRHLIYARFWHKFLFDIGAVNYPEPFLHLKNQGLIMGTDGRKMSKRYGNVVNPDDVVKTYGADTLRVYEMFMGPFENQINWSTESVIGSRRFIERVWRLREKVADAKRSGSSAEGGNSAGNDLQSVMHRTIKKVTEDIAVFSFNTAISAMMIFVNEAERKSEIKREHYEALIKLLAPFAPHLAEEIWRDLGNKGSVHVSEWPVFDESKTAEKTATVVVQINGKVRGEFVADVSAVNEEMLKNMALNMDVIKKWIGENEVKKVIVVKNRLVNIVV